MHSSKMIHLLRSLDRKDLRRLENYIRHPYLVEVKQKQKILQLFEWLRPHHPDYAHPDLEKTRTFAKLFPDETFSVEKLNKIMTRLLQVLRSFIAHEYGNVDHKKREQLLLESQYYQDRSLDTYFWQSIQQLQQLQKKVEQREKDFYYTEYLINRRISEFSSLYNQRKEDLNLLKTHRSLDVFYLVAKLEFACWMLAQDSNHVPLKVQESLQTLEALLPLIERDYEARIPIVALYAQLYRLLRQDRTAAARNKLRELLDAHGHQLPFYQLISIEAIYRSYCVRAYNLSEGISIDYLFQLYRQHLERGYLFRRGGLQPGIIKNLVTFGLKVGDFEWVRQFLDDYRGRIVGTQYPDEVYYYNLANYHFARGHYDRVLDTLEWYSEDNYYKIAIKRLELKVYYEQFSPILESKMDAFKVYIFRLSKKALPIVHREGNNHFINFLRQICNSGTRYNTKKIESIRGKMAATKALVEREWLLEKLAALS